MTDTIHTLQFLQTREKPGTIYHRALGEAIDVLRQVEAGPPVCEECGIYPSDPPSQICVGCEAYKEHTR
jgi:hypothetical protein